MEVYWLGIDKNGKHASYEELQRRNVIAQGWSELGDLQDLTNVIDYNIFCREIHKRGDQFHGNKNWRECYKRPNYIPRIMWELMHLQPGDLVVGVEGTTIRGICQVIQKGADAYKFDPPGESREYVHTIRFANWIDWDDKAFGTPPNVARQGVTGITKFRKQRDSIVAAWQHFKAYSNELELQDTEYQIEVRNAEPEDVPPAPQERPPSADTTGKKWKTNPGRAKRALQAASYNCEIDSTHVTFTSYATNKNYVEAHHLVPMAFQNDFQYSLDVPMSIVALCPNCHRLLHHAKISEKKKLLEFLFRKRESELEPFGISLSMNRLIVVYQ